jgi:hypothetical protein
MRENRETSVSLTADGAVGRIGKARGRTPMMHDPEESDRPIVPAKPSNKAEPSAAERVEGRGLATGNMDEQNAPRTQRRVVGAPSALDHVRQRAKQDRKAKFTTLLHHVTIERLHKAFLQLQKKAAPGIDGVTWEQYAANLESTAQVRHIESTPRRTRNRSRERLRVAKSGLISASP